MPSQLVQPTSFKLQYAFEGTVTRSAAASTPFPPMRLHHHALQRLLHSDPAGAPPCEEHSNRNGAGTHRSRALVAKNERTSGADPANTVIKPGIF